VSSLLGGVDSTLGAQLDGPLDVFATRPKHRGGVDQTVSQLRLEGEWLPIVPGSFYTDGEGGFACTAAEATPGERAELTGPIWAIEDVKRELPTAVEPVRNRRAARHRIRRPHPRPH
jgi:hypothetical protein